MSRSFRLCALLMLLVHTGVAAQQRCPYSLRIIAVDAQTREPVGGASVHLSGRVLPLNDSGVVQINGLCADTLRLKIVAVGYRTLEKNIRVGKDARMTFLLKAGNIALADVQVKGSAVPPVKTREVLSGDALNRTRGETLGDALKNVSGVSTLQTGSTIVKPVIHGMHSNRVLIMNNGVPQEGQQWGMDHAPEIDPFTAGKITVIKGAESVRYGAGAIGGVVLLQPDALPHDARVFGAADLVAAGNGRLGAASAQVQGGIKKLDGFGWRIQSSARKAGNMRTAEYFLTNTGVQELNFSGAAGLEREKLHADVYYSFFSTENGIFSGAHIGNLDDLLARISTGRPPDEGHFSYTVDAPKQTVKHHLFRLDGGYRFSPKTQLNITYGLQRNLRQEFDIRRAGRSSIPSLDLSLTTHTLDAYLKNEGEKGFRTTVGTQLIGQVNNNVPGTLATPLLPNFDTYGAGMYAIAQRHAGDFDLEAGLRYDYRYLDALGYNREQELYGRTRRFHNFSASGGALWRFAPNWNLRSDLGLAWRPPSANELFSNGLHHGVAAYERGNVHLDPEQTYKWINTLQFSHPKIALELSAYAQYIRNYIYLKPSGELFESIRGVFPTFDYTQTQARFLGADLSLNLPLAPALDLGIKGSVIRARDLRSAVFLPWIPPDRLESGLTWRFSAEKETFIRFAHRFVARQHRYTPGSDYAEPPPAYHLFDLAAGHRFDLGRSRLGIHLSINNIANRLYKDYMNRFRYYGHDTGRNILLRAHLDF